MFRDDDDTDDVLNDVLKMDYVFCFLVGLLLCSLQSASEQEHVRRVSRQLQQLQQAKDKDSKAKVMHGVALLHHASPAFTSANSHRFLSHMRSCCESSWSRPLVLSQVAHVEFVFLRTAVYYRDVLVSLSMLPRRLSTPCHTKTRTLNSKYW